MPLAKYLQTFPGGVKAFSRKVGLHPLTLYRYLNPGHTWSRYASAKTMLRIAEATGWAVTPNDLLNVEERRQQWVRRHQRRAHRSSLGHAVPASAPIVTGTAA